MITERSLKEELAAVPTQYDMKTAILNGDIVIEIGSIANEKRLEEFLDNLEKGIEDKIRITVYGIDGPPSVSMLGYDGNIIMHVVSLTYPKEFRTYYGTCIFNRVIVNEYLVNAFYLTNPDVRHNVLSYSVRKAGRLYCPGSRMI